MAGRYAPSPTGDLHLGNLRTALLAWSFARRSGRGFLVRMEDLDERARPEFYERQLADLREIGVDWDGPVLYQSQRISRYDEVLEQLSASLYECYCTRRELAEVVSAPHQPPGAYNGKCRDLTAAQREAGREKLARLGRAPALRLRTDVLEKTITDEIHGDYTGAVDDFVIRRGDGAYSYNFSAVVDDGDCGVTQIVRGDDLLSSTPRQAYLQDLLGYARPQYIHVPLVLNLDGVRLAKRDGAVTLAELRELGWDSAAVRELLITSLGGDSPDTITREPWLLDVASLAKGPRRAP